MQYCYCLLSWVAGSGKGVTSELGATKEPFSSCYICYQLLQVTTSHYQSLPVATSRYQCYQSLPVATSRYQSLPVATSRYQLPPAAASCCNCYQLLPVATSCYQSLPVAASCYQSLPVATSRYQVDTSYCLSFGDCWMSLHANSCFVFINSLLFQGGSTPLNPH